MVQIRVCCTRLQGISFFGNQLHIAVAASLRRITFICCTVIGLLSGAIRLHFVYLPALVSTFVALVNCIIKALLHRVSLILLQHQRRGPVHGSVFLYPGAG